MLDEVYMRLCSAWIQGLLETRGQTRRWRGLCRLSWMTATSTVATWQLPSIEGTDAQGTCLRSGLWLTFSGLDIWPHPFSCNGNVVAETNVTSRSGFSLSSHPSCGTLAVPDLSERPQACPHLLVLVPGYTKPWLYATGKTGQGSWHWGYATALAEGSWSGTLDTSLCLMML